MWSDARVMKKKSKSVYLCQSCGYHTPQWMGKCPGCGEWETLVPEKAPDPAGRSRNPSRANAGPLPMASIECEDEARLKTGIREFDRVLGGGIVAGSLVLIGGDPGIGKSTLMLQALSVLAQAGKKALYVSGEESLKQLKMRARRLKAEMSPLLVAAETDLEAILTMAEAQQPDVMVVDSIQTVYNPELGSAPGSVTQIQEASIRLMNVAKQSGIPIFLVGHVTKVGTIAGPRIMEHMVDTVLYFEGDRSHVFRILRAVKNRFGSTNEIGVFEMKDKGLAQVPNPSAVFLSERSVNMPGAVVTASMEGTRPILVEIQGLASSSGYGTPRRTVLGLDSNRVALIAAVMEKRLGINLSGLDIFMNVAGGVKVLEPALDMAIAVALASSFLDRPVPEGLTVIGEIGLTGEIRAVSHAEARVKEAAKMGFSTCLLPHNSLKQMPGIAGIETRGVGSLKKVMETLF